MREVTIKCDKCQKEIATGVRPEVYEAKMAELFQIKASARFDHQTEKAIVEESDVCGACLPGEVTTLGDRVASEASAVRAQVGKGQPFMVQLLITGWGTNADAPAARQPKMAAAR
jgi:hypothetical protein